MLTDKVAEKEFWCRLSKVSIICTLISLFRAKYITFDLKSTEELSFMLLKCHAKFGKKLTCVLENDLRNLAISHQSTRKCQNWDFDGILLSKMENAWAKKSQRSYVTLKDYKKFEEEEVTVPFKIDIRNLTKIDSSTRKSQKFAL